ncbi:MAG: GNAT family N-acetyltransferase [Chloroflexi bacterium]|nr:GNAT family N-acetyltransferase [Chloroflexota bacterium]
MASTAGIPEVEARSPRSLGEVEGFARLQARTWNPRDDPDLRVSAYRKMWIESGGESWRGIFDHDVNGEIICLSGCIVDQRWLRLPPAKLLAGCIGGVATHPDFRQRGLGSAVLRSAVTYGKSRGCAVLLLDGITNFYHRWGFVDVWDLTVHSIPLSAVARLRPGSYGVRRATVADAEALLRVYEACYGERPGSFDRTLSRQERLLGQLPPQRQVWLAMGSSGGIAGYLALDVASPAQALEVAAESFDAAAALLRFHAQVAVTENSGLSEVRWPLPPDDPLVAEFADAFVCAGFPYVAGEQSQWPVVRSETVHASDGGWMARIADPAVLMRAMLPRWQELWAAVRPAWRGVLALVVDDVAFPLALSDAGLQLCASERIPDLAVRLTRQVFLQLLFGYRPLAWAVRQTGQEIPESARPVLARLFASHAFWIPRSDWF